MAELLEFLTPVGRIVQGHPFTGNTTDQQGNPLVHKQGVNIGQPYTNWFLGLAIPKTDPGMQPLLDIMGQSAAAGWPGGQAGLPGFSWKYFDGDGPDANGQLYSLREGMTGCYILRLNSQFAPQIYKNVGGNLVQMTEGVKRGDYVRVSGTTKGNDNPSNPGIYMNLNMIEFAGYGDEIRSGPDGQAVFGGAAPIVLPAGASATPTAAAIPIAPVAPVAAPAPVAPVTPAPVAPVTPVAPVAPVAPAPVVPAPVAPVAPAPAPVPAPVAPAPVVPAPVAAPAPTQPYHPILNPTGAR